MRSDFGSNIIMELEKKLGLTSGKTLLRDFSGLKSMPGVDVKKAFQIISQLESGGGYVIGDSGTSFGATQVQFGSFLNGLAKDPQAEALTGLSAESLKNMQASWSQAKAKIASMPLWKITAIDPNEVAAFVRQHPQAVVKRREGTTIRFSPETFTVVRLPSYQANTLDLDALERIGLDTSLPTVRRQLSEIISQYVTDAVVRNAIAKLLVMRADPESYNRFQNTFSRRSVRNNQQLRDLADRVAQNDFMNKVNHVLHAVQESGYNTNAPGAYNIYQLIAIANASGAGRVSQFLRSKKPFGSGHLHYLQRANPLIAKVTGFPTAFPSDEGLGGFQAFASLSIRKQASFVLNFPSQYTEDLRSGKRQMTIRQGDIPAQINQIVRCETYSGAYICDVIITSKETMSTTRIRKAFGQKVADELESKFGPGGRFMVIRFALKENKNDDDFGGNSFGKSVPIEQDDSNLENIPNGRTMTPVEPGHYHASRELSLSKIAELEQIKSIWDLAEMISLADSADEWLKQHGLEDNEEKESEEDEDGDVSEQWREKERKRMEELIRQRKQQQSAPVITQPKSTTSLVEKVVEKDEDIEEDAGIEENEDIEENEGIEEDEGDNIESNQEQKKPELKPIVAPRLTFEEHMRGVDIPTIEKEEVVEEEESDSLSSLIRKLEDTENIEDVLTKLTTQEDEEESKEERADKTTTRVRLENKKTIYGFRMVPPENGWHDVPQPPSMTEEARGLLSASNLRTFNSMNKLFSDPKTWNILNAQPNKQAILQQWVLPALIYNIGKRWFEIYANRNKLAAFSLFSPDQLEQAIVGGKPLDQTEVGRNYMKKIIIHVTDAANSYFSQAAHRNVPIANYINAIVRHKMEREIGFENGYKMREKPLCAICKGEEKWGVIVKNMVETSESEETKRKSMRSNLPYAERTYVDTRQKGSGGKKAIPLYTCENCARKANEIMNRDVQQTKSLINSSEKKARNLDEKIQNINMVILNIQERIKEFGENAERLEKLSDAQKQIERMGGEKSIIAAELNERKELLSHQLQQVRKYNGQVNVPFIHLWCPNQQCPGQRVPLTAVDWSVKDFWKSQSGEQAVKFLQNNYGIKYPLEVEQTAADLPSLSPEMVNSIVVSKLPAKEKLHKLFGIGYDRQLDFSQIKDFVTKYDKILLQSPSFRTTILKIYRLLEEVPDLRSALERSPAHTYHIPPKEIWDVPFVCPHDNVKFTIREALGKSGETQIIKGQRKHTEFRGGLFYKPYMKTYWYKEGEEEQVGTDYENVGTKNDHEEMLAYRELIGVARDIFLKRYWDRFAIIEKFKRDNPFLAAKPEKLAANPRFQEQLAILKLYDSVREFSADNPETYVGWLASREFRLTFEQRKSGIAQTTAVTSSKNQTEEIYVPILQKWFDSMVTSKGGFEKFGLHTWLVNEKEDGIPSYPAKSNVKENVGSEGTYFLAKIEPLGKNSLGFKMGLVSKQRRRGFGSQPRMIRIVGAWEVARENAEQLEKAKVLGQTALNLNEVQALKRDYSNRISEIQSHDYRSGVLDSEADFLPGNYILVQAYLMPTVRNWKPIENLYRLRTDADDEYLFSEFGQLAVLNENNPAFWAKFRKEVAQYKQDPESVARFIRSKLDKEKKTSCLSSRGKFFVSMRDY